MKRFLMALAATAAACGGVSAADAQPYDHHYSGRYDHGRGYYHHGYGRGRPYGYHGNYGWRYRHHRYPHHGYYRNGHRY